MRANSLQFGTDRLSGQKGGHLDRPSVPLISRNTTRGIEMNSLDRAQRSEAMFLVYCAEQSIESAKPLFHSAPYDFVFRIKGKWKTVQVKTCFVDKRKTNPIISLRHSGDYAGKKSMKPYEPGDWDYVFCVFGNRRWLIPARACSHIRSSLAMGKKVKQYEV